MKYIKNECGYCKGNWNIFQFPTFLEVPTPNFIITIHVYEDGRRRKEMEVRMKENTNIDIKPFTYSINYFHPPTQVPGLFEGVEFRTPQ